MRAHRRVVLLVAILLFFGVGMVSARQILRGDDCSVEAETVVTANLFVICRTLVVDGRITGDLLGIAASAEISGVVEGDVYLAAGRLDIFGEIGGSLHYGGAALSIAPQAEFTDPRADLYTASLSALLNSTSLPGNVTGIGYQMLLRGEVGGEVSFWGSALEIAAPVGGDVYATVGNPNTSGVTALSALLTPLDVSLGNPGLRVTQAGTIGGQLTYAGPVPGEIEATLANAPIYIDTTDQITIVLDQPDFGASVAAYLVQIAREFVSVGLFGVLIFLLVPRVLQAPLTILRWRPLPSVGVGLLAFILSFPFIFIAVAISLGLVLLVGLLRLPDLTIATALILGVLNFSAAGLFYFVAIYVSRVLVCLAIGRVLTRRLWGDANSLRAWLVGLLVGVLILSAVSSLPVVGVLINALSVFFGLGAIITHILAQFERARDARIPTDAPPLPDEIPITRAGTLVLPPPVVDEPNSSPGMDNLPEGFNWWR